MSVTSDIDAPSPPNSTGIWAPRSLCLRAASMAFRGKRASRSTASTSVAAASATAAVRCWNEARAEQNCTRLFSGAKLWNWTSCTFMAQSLPSNGRTTRTASKMNSAQFEGGNLTDRACGVGGAKGDVDEQYASERGTSEVELSTQVVVRYLRIDNDRAMSRDGWG